MNIKTIKQGLIMAVFRMCTDDFPEGGGRSSIFSLNCVEKWGKMYVVVGHPPPPLQMAFAKVW